MSEVGTEDVTGIWMDGRNVIVAQAGTDVLSIYQPHTVRYAHWRDVYAARASAKNEDLGND